MVFGRRRGRRYRFVPGTSSWASLRVKSERPDSKSTEPLQFWTLSLVDMVIPWQVGLEFDYSLAFVAGASPNPWVMMMGAGLLRCPYTRGV